MTHSYNLIPLLKSGFKSKQVTSEDPNREGGWDEKRALQLLYAIERNR